MIKKHFKKIIFPVVTILTPIISLAAGLQGTIKDPLGGKFGDVRQLITFFVDWIINLGTVAVVLYFIYIGFQFVAARGNPEEIKKNRMAFFWAVVGTLVLIGGKVLVKVIESTLKSGGLTS